MIKKALKSQNSYNNSSKNVNSSEISAYYAQLNNKLINKGLKDKDVKVIHHKK